MFSQDTVAVRKVTELTPKMQRIGRLSETGLPVTYFTNTPDEV